MGYLPGEQLLASIEIEDIDPCSLRGLEGRGSRARAWCTDNLSEGGSGPQLVVIPENKSNRIDKFAISRTEVKIGEYNAFCEATGIANRDLPIAEDGEPSRYLPDGLEPGHAWVPLMSGKAGEQERLWKGFAPNIVRALSLVPDEARRLVPLAEAEYVKVAEATNMSIGRDSLSRTQIEVLATRVSALNECFY